MYPVEFEDNYMMSAENFAREMLLDPSECENCLYILPQLTRDSFCKKGLFYRTDKILIQNYSNCFQFPSAARAKERLEETQILVQSILSQEHTKKVFHDLLTTNIK